MVFWRISNYLDLSGVGAERSDGRWHKAAPEKRIVYLAEHPAVALIENLVNLDGDPSFFPKEFQLLKMSFHHKAPASDLTRKQLSLLGSQDAKVTQAIGDAWLAKCSSALLRVPSIPSPESWNYLLNPLHTDANRMRIEWAKTIAYDRRLFRLSE